MGPGSIAGLRGPERSELDQLYPLLVLAPGIAGEVSSATDGRSDLPGVSLVGSPLNDCSNGLGSREKGLCIELK